MNISMILVVIIVITTGAAATEGYLLRQAWQKQAVQQYALDAAKKKITEMNNVLREADKIHQTNNALPDDKLFDSLLPTAPSP